MAPARWANVRCVLNHGQITTHKDEQKRVSFFLSVDDPLVSSLFECELLSYSLSSPILLLSSTSASIAKRYHDVTSDYEPHNMLGFLLRKDAQNLRAEAGAALQRTGQLLQCKATCS